MEPNLRTSSTHRGNNGELTASPHLYRNKQREGSDGSRQFSILQSSDETSVREIPKGIQPKHFLLDLLGQKSDDSSQERMFAAVCGMFEQLQQALVTTTQENAELRERVALLEAAAKIQEKILQEQFKALKGLYTRQLKTEEAHVIPGEWLANEYEAYSKVELRDLLISTIDEAAAIVIADQAKMTPEELKRFNMEPKLGPVTPLIDRINIIARRSPEITLRARILREKRNKIKEAMAKAEIIEKEPKIKDRILIHQLREACNQHAEVINCQNERIKRLESLLVEKGKK